MRTVIQRVSEAAVEVEHDHVGKIHTGLLVLVGIESDDKTEDMNWLANKIINLRIFPDAAGVMNKSLLEIDGDLLLISQFTLHASTKKGNRPSYIRAAPPEIAIPLYEDFKKILSASLPRPVQCGVFGADMKVSLVNDGPVTIMIDSKNKE